MLDLLDSYDTNNQSYNNYYGSSNYSNSQSRNANPPSALATTQSSSKQVEVDFLLPDLAPISPSGSSGISTSSSFSSSSSQAGDDWILPSTPARARTTPTSRALTPATSNYSSATAIPMTTTQIVVSNKKSNYGKELHVPRSHNPLRTDAVHPDKLKMKAQRKKRIASGTATGMLVGGLVLGPVGIFLGGAAAGLVTKKVCKAGEKRVQRKFEKQNVQKGASRSAAAKYGYMT